MSFLSHFVKQLNMERNFIVKFHSRCDATLFHNEVQKLLRKERSYNGFTECESSSHWKENGGCLVVASFKDPLTIDEAKNFHFGFDTEWKYLPSSYILDDLLNLEWS